ncbi:MAG: hypothetical protein ACYC9L_16020 [Sulfuricaulis sp.]
MTNENSKLSLPELQSKIANDTANLLATLAEHRREIPLVALRSEMGDRSAGKRADELNTAITAIERRIEGLKAAGAEVDRQLDEQREKTIAESRESDILQARALLEERAEAAAALDAALEQVGAEYRRIHRTGHAAFQLVARHMPSQHAALIGPSMDQVRLSLVGGLIRFTGLIDENSLMDFAAHTLDHVRTARSVTKAVAIQAEQIEARLPAEITGDAA